MSARRIVDTGLEFHLNHNFLNLCIFPVTSLFDCMQHFDYLGSCHFYNGIIFMPLYLRGILVRYAVVNYKRNATCNYIVSTYTGYYN